MLEPNDFVARWGKDEDSLLRFPKKTVQSLRIHDDDKAFLVQAGLPKSAAPFLSFEAPSFGELLTIAQQYSLPEEFDRYRAIGFDGGGSPIAIDEEAGGEVVCLDHEDRFARMFMNESIRQLAESLLGYRKLVQDTLAEFGENGYLDGKASPSARKALRQELKRIDQAALKAGCFWHGELLNLDADAV